jgi:bifunctional DNase/RNase
MRFNHVSASCALIRVSGLNGMIEVNIESMRVSLTTQQRVVILKDNTTDRYLAIFIGPFEADAINFELQEVQQRRPLTHDLMKSLIEELGARMLYAWVNDLREDIYYARLVIEMGDGSRTEVDCRPSDAIALAIRAKVPIYVEETVLDRAGIRPEADVELEADNETGEGSEPVEPGRLSAFADFLDSLDLDDLSGDEDK